MRAGDTPWKALSVILSLKMEHPQYAGEANTGSQKNSVIQKLVFGAKVQFFEYFRGTSSDFSRRMKLECCEVRKASPMWGEKSACDQGSGCSNTFDSNSASEISRL